MKDERIPILIRISDEYGICYDEEEAEELLEIFDKVTRESFNAVSQSEVDRLRSILKEAKKQ